MQQMVGVETPHCNGTRLGLAHSSSATQDQPLSCGSGHGGFGQPRQLILSEEHRKLRKSDEGLALFVQPGAMMPATYTPYHRHAYDGPTPAQFYFPPGADSTTMLPQAAAAAAPQLLQLKPLPLIRRLLGPLPPPVPPPLPLQLSAPPPLPLQLLAHSALPPNQRRHFGYVLRSVLRLIIPLANRVLLSIAVRSLSLLSCSAAGLPG